MLIPTMKMKKIYLIIVTLIGLFVVGCNPMEDINNDIDKINEDKLGRVVGVLIVILGFAIFLKVFL